MARWTLDELSRLIDHTNIHADATEEDLAKLCDEVRRRPHCVEVSRGRLAFDESVDRADDVIELHRFRHHVDRPF